MLFLTLLDTNLLGLSHIFVAKLNAVLSKTPYSPESQQRLVIPSRPGENSSKPVENIRGIGEILGKSWGN
jgi:hypothetical protein